MKLSILAGSTSQTINVFIQDSSSSTGAGLTGLVYNTASLTAYYALPRAAAVAITLATLAAVTSGFSSGGFKEIDATNMPGWYRLDLPDAALASGRFVSIHLKGASNMAPLPIEIELTAVNNQSATNFITAVNGVAQTGDSYARLGAPAGASHAADIAAVKADTAATLIDTAEIGAAGAGLTAITSKTDNLPSDPADQSLIIAATNSLATLIGTPSVSLAADIATRASQASVDTVDTVVDTILVDTNELQTDWANGGRLDNILDARASQSSVDDLPTNAELATALASADDAVLAQVALVKAQTDNLPSDPADQSLIIAATNSLAALIGTPSVSLAADIATRASQSSVDTIDAIVDAIKLVADRLNTTIESTGSPSSFVFTAEALAQAPSGGGGGPSAAQIADAVWDEIISGHAGVGSTGAALAAAGGSGDPWATALPGAYGDGTAGKIIGDNLSNVEGSLSHGDLMRVIAAVLAGKTTVTELGGGAATVTFAAADGTDVRVTATMAGSVRTQVTLAP